MVGFLEPKCLIGDIIFLLGVAILKCRRTGIRLISILATSLCHFCLVLICRIRDYVTPRLCFKESVRGVKKPTAFVSSQSRAAPSVSFCPPPDVVTCHIRSVTIMMQLVMIKDIQHVSHLPSMRSVPSKNTPPSSIWPETFDLSGTHSSSNDVCLPTPLNHPLYCP